MPASVGGRGCTTLQQVLVQEQGGRVTNGIAWCLATPPSWWPEVANDHQRETVAAADGPRRDGGVLRDHRGGRRLRRLRPDRHRAPRRRRLRARRREVARHVVQRGRLRLLPGRADRAASTRATRRCSSSTSDAPGVRVVRTPAYTHTLGHDHPIVAFEGVRVPASHLVGTEEDGMSFVYEWFRFERLMVAARCLGAAERLIEEATAFAQERIVGGAAAGRAAARAGDARRQPDRAVRGPVDDLRDGPLDRRGRRPQGAARAVLDGEALRLRDGRPGRRPGASRSSAAAATCARTSPSGSTASSGSSGSGRAPARCSG